MIIYLCGPMSHRADSDYNYPSFHAATAQLRSAGFIVINPAENFDGDTSRPRNDYLDKAFRQVASAGRVAALPGWEDSVGASTEIAIAAALGIPVFKYDGGWGPLINFSVVKSSSPPRINPWAKTNPVPVHETILAEANRLINDDAFDRELDEIRDLHAAKRADYTGDESALANYEFASGMMGVPVVTGMFGRLCEKAFRIKSLLGTGREPKVTDEKMTDTLRDIAIIATLMRLHLSGEPGYQNLRAALK